jgi:aryl sulfotransferase
MTVSSPTPRHLYRNHSLDGRRWARYEPREDDIIVASSYKSGTTWLQVTLLRLVLGDVERPPLMEMSPWLESPLAPIEHVIATLEHQRHRRVIKTHLPLDGVPHFPNVTYLVIARDPRDVFMSLWNHYRNIVRYPFLAAPRHPLRVGPPLPSCPADARQFWREWMTRGWFEWESEGYPFWSNLRHTQSWWESRHLPNVVFVHFNDLLGNLNGEVSSMAKRLGVEIDSARLRTLVEAVTFDSMKRDAARLLPNADAMLRGGAQTFFHKGTNGRWRDVLTDEDLVLYEQAAARELSDECRRWLEGGRASGIDPKSA